MEERVVQALFDCTQVAVEVRQAAECFLDASKSEPGFGVLLLNISHNSNNAMPIRQLAAIILKNQCKKWKDSPLNQQDKEFIKGNIIQCLKFSVAEEIRSQFEEVVFVIGRNDKDIEGVLGQVLVFLDGDADCLYAALDVLHQFSKQYEYVISEKRNSLRVLMGRFFDKLELSLEKLMTEQTPTAFSYINLILQIYWVCFYIELLPEQATERSLNSWLSKIIKILSVEFDIFTSKDHYEQELKSKELKMQCKKWSIQILYRFFSRYHDFSSQIDSNIIIGQVFMSKWSHPVLETILGQIFDHQTRFIPDSTMNYYIKFINQAIKIPAICDNMKTIKRPDGEFIIPSLITQVITPVVCKTLYDEELWTDNPIEYIRKQADLSQIYYSASSAAIDLLDSMCERGYLPQFLEYLNSSLANNLPPLTKEALIYEVGSLSQELSKHDNLANLVPQMLSNHIFSELSSSIGFLRARACWAYGQFSSYNFPDPDHQKQVLEKICLLVLDPQLPVKYEAALALPKILNWEVSKSRVKGEISQVLKIYLDLINEIDSEEIIEALEDIVTGYSDEVLPFAIDLCSQLVGTFQRLAIKEHMNEDDDSAMAAVSVLNTISKIIETVNDKPENLVQISQLIYPVLEYSISQQGSAFMDEALNILSSILYYAPANSLANLFPLCKVILSSLQDNNPYGAEKHEEIFPALANFISKYPGLIIPDLQSLVNFFLLLLGKDITLTVLSCKLLISVFEHLKSATSFLVPVVIQRLCSTIQTSVSHKEKTILCQVIYVAFWADPVGCMTFMDQNNIFKSTFNYSLNNLKYVKEKISRIQVVVGVASFLSQIPAFPNSLSFENSVMIFKKFVEMLLLVENEDKEEEGESPFVDAEEFNAKTQEILEKIRQNFEEDDEDDEVLYETDADEFYDSMFENFDYKAYVKSELVKLPSEVLTHLTGAIDAEQQILLKKTL